LESGGITKCWRPVSLFVDEEKAKGESASQPMALSLARSEFSSRPRT